MEGNVIYHRLDRLQAEDKHSMILLVHLLLQLAFIDRVLLRPHRDPSSRVAWIAVIMAVPVFGMIAYLLLGETSIGRVRAARLNRITENMPSPREIPGASAEGVAPALNESQQTLFRVGTSISGYHPVGGNQGQLMADSNATIDADSPPLPSEDQPMISNPEASFGMEDARHGKLGLALSGGGFRASLFHLGVLARLADLDILRYVATISTVSGGSIIGAFYQLKVKQLLEGRRDDRLAPSAQAFRQLVGEVEREFVQAIQHNLRICTFTDREKNARMLSNSYSTSERLAELFEAHFFAPIIGRDKTSLRDLLITPTYEAAPPGDQAAFQAPELIMNSTALNTGHLFQFTGQCVGEGPVDSVLGGIAPMSSLDRIYLQDPNLRRRQRARLDRITVGDAVAASSCVPGLLEPFKLTDLYQDEDGNDATVRLVDGGVFDNQGLASLFEADCTHFICSDATDLLSWNLDPSERMHNVLMRTNDIMMDRVRAELMEELITRGSDRYAVFTLGDLDGPKVFSREAVRIVSALAHIRTDLDAFSDTEAAALMYYGFLLSGHTLSDGQIPDTRPVAVSTATTDNRQPDIFSQRASESASPHPWAFEWVSDALADPASRETLIKQMELGSHSLFKVFHMGKALPRLLAVVPLCIPIAMLAWVVSSLPPVPIVAWLLIVLVALSALAYNQNTRLVRWLDQIDWLRRWRKRLTIALKPLGITVFLGLLLAAASRLYLRVFNRLFLRYGRPPGETP